MLDFPSLSSRKIPAQSLMIYFVSVPKERFEGMRRGAQSIVAWTRGNIQAVDTYLADLIKHSSASSAYQIAQVYGCREDADKACEWLEKSFAQYGPGSLSAPFEAVFSFMHEDPRWEFFVEKVSK